MIPLGDVTYGNMPEGYRPYVYRHKDATKIIHVLVCRYMEGHDDLQIMSKITNEEHYADIQPFQVERTIETALVNRCLEMNSKPNVNVQREMDRLMEATKDYLLECGEVDVDRRGGEWEVTYVTRETHTREDKTHYTIPTYHTVAFSAPRGSKWVVFYSKVEGFARNHDAISIKYVSVRFPRQHRGRLPKLMR